jgi:hypothetical protein
MVGERSFAIAGLINTCIKSSIGDVQPIPIMPWNSKEKEIFAMLDDKHCKQAKSFVNVIIQHGDGDITCTPPIDRHPPISAIFRGPVNRGRNK